ncbi:MAG: hypothetical protein ACOCUH_02065, partial [Bacteriovoracia bacterium]
QLTQAGDEGPDLSEFQEAPFGKEESSEEPPSDWDEDTQTDIDSIENQEEEFFAEKTQEFDNPLAEDSADEHNQDVEDSWDGGNNDSEWTSDEESSDFDSTDFDSENGDFETGDFETGDFDSNDSEETPPPPPTEGASSLDELSSEDSSNEKFGQVEDSGFSNEFEMQQNDDLTADRTDGTYESSDESNDSNDSDFSDQDEIEEEKEVEEAQELEKETKNQNVSEPELTPGPIEKTETKTPSAPENFNDIRNFAESIAYGTVASGGNPPFSIKITNVVYQEDAEDIMNLMREHGLLKPDNEEHIQRSLSMGSLLISQVGEYSAIYLAHRLRKLNVELAMGLADEIHPTKAYSSNNKGLVTKNSIHQNQRNSLELKKEEVALDDIILATSSTLENYTITNYLGLATEHTTLPVDELSSEAYSDRKTEDNKDSQNEINQIKEEIDASLKQLGEDHEFPQITLNEIYSGLAEKLKVQSLQLGGNAIIGINYQLTPLTGQNYKITCTGNIVWAEKL